VHRFPDRETLVRVRGEAGREAILIHSLFDPDATLVPTLLASDALRRRGAQRVTLVAPYLPYMRQDRVFRLGEPISQHVVGRLLADAFDRVLTLEAHLHRTSRLSLVAGRRSCSLSAAPVLARAVRTIGTDVFVVGPDVESTALVRAVARAAGVPFVVGRKQRLGDRRVRIALPSLPSCTHAVMVDDVASSGETLLALARLLRRAGTRRVDALVVHPIFGGNALARLRAAGVRRILACDTVPHRVARLSCASLFAEALA